VFFDLTGLCSVIGCGVDGGEDDGFEGALAWFGGGAGPGCVGADALPFFSRSDGTFA